MKKTIALLLVAALLTIAAGCGNKTSEKVRMYIWAGNEEPWGGKPQDVLAMQEWVKHTGIDIEYQYPHGDMAEEFKLMMANGKNLPDLLWNTWSSKALMDYARTKKIVDIAPYMEKHMPNLYALAQANKRLKAQLYSEDGQVLYLPWISEKKIFFEGMAIRKDWLEATGLPVPKTNDELTNVLMSMKKLAAAGKLPHAQNFMGITGDTWGLCKWFYGFGSTDDYLLEDDGKTVNYGPITDGYRKGLIWLNKLYREKLIDPDVFSGDQSLFKKHILNNQAAVKIDNWGVISGYTLDAAKNGDKIEFVAVPYPLYKNEAIPREYNSTTKRVAQIYGFALTTKDEGKLIKILEAMDYIYSPAGRELFNWGIEGKTFVKDADGSKSFTDLVMNDPKYPPEVAMTKYCKPDITAQDYEQQFALTGKYGQSVMKVWADTDYKYSWEPFMWYTADEYKALSALGTDWATYKNEMRDKFLSNKLDPNNDAEWQKYIDTMKKLGVLERIKIQQQVYDRFIKRVQ